VRERVDGDIMTDEILTKSEHKLIDAITIVNKILTNQIVDKAIENAIARGVFVDVD
jgi:hypothetical protein